MIVTPRNAILFLIAIGVMVAVPLLRKDLKREAYQNRLADGVILESTPLSGKTFSGTSIYVLDYSDMGAQGLVIGQSLQDGLQRLSYKYHEHPNLKPLRRLIGSDLTQSDNKAWFWGGPVAMDQYAALSLQPIDGGSDLATDGLFANMNLSEHQIAMAPHTNYYAGYAGWISGQLDREVRAGDWRVYKPKVTQLHQLLGLGSHDSNR